MNLVIRTRMEVNAHLFFPKKLNSLTFPFMSSINIADDDIFAVKYYVLNRIVYRISYFYYRINKIFNKNLIYLLSSETLTSNL